MKKGRDGEWEEKKNEMKKKKIIIIIVKIVATIVVASRPPNGDRLQRRPLVPKLKHFSKIYNLPNFWLHNSKNHVFPAINVSKILVFLQKDFSLTSMLTEDLFEIPSLNEIII